MRLWSGLCVWLVCGSCVWLVCGKMGPHSASFFAFFPKASSARLWGAPNAIIMFILSVQRELFCDLFSPQTPKWKRHFPLAKRTEQRAKSQELRATKNNNCPKLGPKACGAHFGRALNCNSLRNGCRHSAAICWPPFGCCCLLAIVFGVLCAQTAT